MQSRGEEKKGLTVDLLDKILKRAKGMKNVIESDSVEQEDMHMAVHNSVSQIL